MSVRIEPWGRGDLPILEGALLDPAMTEHIGGPESPERIARRQTRYEQPGSGQYKIVDETTGEGMGWVGYWDREWGGEDVYEVGWAVLPAFQGRGAATAGMTQLLEVLRAERKHRYVLAYPSVDNAPSNAICRKTGFTLLGEEDFEYPPGTTMRCNDWRYDLESDA
jgi:RimJ/RimL family protein N-acetyltransferase